MRRWSKPGCLRLGVRVLSPISPYLLASPIPQWVPYAAGVWAPRSMPPETDAQIPRVQPVSSCASHLIGAGRFSSTTAETQCPMSSQAARHLLSRRWACGNYSMRGSQIGEVSATGERTADVETNSFQAFSQNVSWNAFLRPR